MFGSLNRRLAKLIAGEKEKEDSEALVASTIRRLKEQSDAQAKRSAGSDDSTGSITELMDIVRHDDVSGLMGHIEKHGLSAARVLTEASTAGLDFKEKQQIRIQDEQAFWTASPPHICAEQQELLDQLPKGAPQDQIRERMRTGLIFDLDMRPAKPSDKSFAGGLPFVGSGLIWPRDTRTGQPLTFVGQIDVADLPDFPLRAFYPDTGAIVFFAPSGSGNDASLIQHVSLQNAQEVPLPDDMASYRSSFRTAFRGTGECQIGWLHEQGMDKPPFSVLPKWPLTPRLAAFAPQDGNMYDLDCPIPDNMLAQHDGDIFTFYETFGRALNGLPERRSPAHQELFDGFPHVWGAVADITQRFLPLIDSYQETHGADTPSDVAVLRALVSSWRDKAIAAGAAAPVSDLDRAGFRADLAILSADYGVALPAAKDAMLGVKVLNDPKVMNDFLFLVQTYWTLSSMCSDPTTLPDAVRAEMIERFSSEFPSKGHIQSLGHTHEVPGEEWAQHSVLMMQFPWSYITDVTGVFGFDGLRYWMSYEDFQNRSYDKAHCSS